MTLPAFVQARAFGTLQGNYMAVTFSSAIQDGDLTVCIISGEGGDYATDNALVWTKPQNFTATNTRTNVFYRTWHTGDNLSAEFTNGGPAGQGSPCVLHAAVYRDAAYLSSANHSHSGSPCSTTILANGLTFGANGGILLVGFGWNGHGEVSDANAPFCGITPPASMQELKFTNENRFAILETSQEVVGSGASGTRTATATISGASHCQFADVAASIAIEGTGTGNTSGTWGVA